MQLRAVVTLADLVALLEQATPLRISMKDDARRWIELERPSEVSLVPGRGARVVVSGRLQLDVADVPLLAKIKSLELMLIPTLAQPAQLVFKIVVEQLDVAYVPGLIEDALVPRVNAALAPFAARLAWNFGKTLHASLKIPPHLEPLERFELAVTGAQVEVDAERIRLDVELSTSLSRSS
jgi:hypothetical protein